MATQRLTLRAVKGSPLTSAEADADLLYLEGLAIPKWTTVDAAIVGAYPVGIIVDSAVTGKRYQLKVGGNPEVDPDTDTTNAHWNTISASNAATDIDTTYITVAANAPIVNGPAPAQVTAQTGKDPGDSTRVQFNDAVVWYKFDDPAWSEAGRNVGGSSTIHVHQASAATAPVPAKVESPTEAEVAAWAPGLGGNPGDAVIYTTPAGAEIRYEYALNVGDVLVAVKETDRPEYDTTPLPADFTPGVNWRIAVRNAAGVRETIYVNGFGNFVVTAAGGGSSGGAGGVDVATMTAAIDASAPLYDQFINANTPIPSTKNTYGVYADTSAGAITATLPEGLPNGTERTFARYLENASAPNVLTIIVGNGATETINGQVSVDLNTGQTWVTIKKIGGVWHSVANGSTVI